MLVASVLLPIEGRAASTIRLPGWKPPVSSSRSVKPDGVPVSPTSPRESSSSLSISSWSTASIERISPRPSSWPIWKSVGLGALDQLARVAPVHEHLVLDLAGGREQPAQQRVLLDDARVVEDVAHGRNDRGQRVHVALAAGLLELAVAAQVVADRQRVDGLWLGLLLQAHHRPEDQLVARAVEVVGPQADLEQDAVERLLGEQDRAEDGGLGLGVLRRDASAGLGSGLNGDSHGRVAIPAA